MSIGDSNTIFPSNSPIERSWTGSTDLKTPKPMPCEVFDRKYASMLKKIKPLLEVKKEADKNYSAGYFENHYPDADKKLKNLLHRKAMDAWANSLAKDVPGADPDAAEEATEPEHAPKTISITINLGV